MSENQELSCHCAALEQKSRDLEMRLVQTEQYSRNMNTEIQGDQENEDEDVTVILSKLSDSVKEPITNLDVEAAHRVPTRTSGKSNIVVRFKSKAKRDAMLQKSKKMRLTAEDVGLDSKDPVYVNEHLTPENKKLLGAAIAKKKQIDWKHVWTRNGAIYARQTDVSKVIRLYLQDDLSKMT